MGHNERKNINIMKIPEREEKKKGTKTALKAIMA